MEYILRIILKILKIIKADENVISFFSEKLLDSALESLLIRKSTLSKSLQSAIDDSMLLFCKDNGWEYNTAIVKDYIKSMWDIELLHSSQKLLEFIYRATAHRVDSAQFNRWRDIFIIYISTYKKYSTLQTYLSINHITLDYFEKLTISENNPIKIRYNAYDCEFYSDLFIGYTEISINAIVSLCADGSWRSVIPEHYDLKTHKLINHDSFSFEDYFNTDNHKVWNIQNTKYKLIAKVVDDDIRIMESDILDCTNLRKLKKPEDYYIKDKKLYFPDDDEYQILCRAYKLNKTKELRVSANRVYDLSFWLDKDEDAGSWDREEISIYRRGNYLDTLRSDYVTYVYKSEPNNSKA